MIEYFIIAILQGFLEWLPISSSGQVIIVAILVFNIPNHDAFSLAIWIHFGTTLAVLVKYRTTYLNAIKSFLPNTFNSKEKHIKDRNLLIFATIGTAISGLPLYFLFKFVIINFFIASYGDLLTLIIAGFLIITGIILSITRKKYGNKEFEVLSLSQINKDSLIAGIAQGVSILPGISRSGTTVSTFLLQKYKQNNALRLSFLISVPVVFASILVDLLFGEGSIMGVNIFILLISCSISFIIGYLTMEFLIKISRNIRFGYFCIAYVRFK
jgi:undecaprenyl-diphosphatase